MIDLVELASSINPELPEKKQKEEFCDLLLEKLRILKGMDLAPYLSECFFDKLRQVQVLTISFPMGTHVFDSGVSNIKGDGDNRDNTDM